jgi:hypothetical protein
LREEVARGLRILCNEELHNLQASPIMIRMIKLRRMIRAGHIVYMGDMKMHVNFWFENLKG